MCFNNYTGIWNTRQPWRDFLNFLNSYQWQLVCRGPQHQKYWTPSNSCSFRISSRKILTKKYAISRIATGHVNICYFNFKKIQFYVMSSCARRNMQWDDWYKLCLFIIHTVFHTLFCTKIAFLRFFSFFVVNFSILIRRIMQNCRINVIYVKQNKFATCFFTTEEFFKWLSAGTRSTWEGKSFKFEWYSCLWIGKFELNRLFY